MAIASAFGPLLRQHRENAGLSQEELAERAGLTAAAIGALERGERRRPYPHTLQLLATALALNDPDRSALIAAVAGGGALARTHRARRLPHVPNATAFVGRDVELAFVQARLAEAKAGHGGVVMLVGEAGIGKTRLALEIAEKAQLDATTVLWGSCFEGDWQPAYAPWVEAIGKYASDRTARELRNEMGFGAAALARLVPDVDAALPDLPAPSALAPDEERYRLYDAVARFLEVIATERTVLVVLDDLHWADAGSLQVLSHCARNLGGAPVLLLGAFRDPELGISEKHPLVGTLARLRRECDFRQITLRGFTPAEVESFLENAAGIGLPQALVRAIEQETRGNPFYTHEVLRHLTEEEVLKLREGRWYTDFSIGELGIPEGVRQVVSHRLARLSERTSNLLKQAAGLSGAFGLDLLAALSDLPDEVLLDCLDEALAAGLLQSSSTVPPRYEFAHAIVRHTLYEAFNKNPDRRVRLHRRIALALEQIYAAHESEGAAEIAAQYHASLGLTGAERGVRYARIAAEQARRAFAHDRAAGFWRMAADLARNAPPEEQADILSGLAIAQAEAFDFENARASAETALEVLRTSNASPRACAEFLAAISRALKDVGADAALWEPLVQRGLDFVGQDRDLLWSRLALMHDRFEAVQSGPIGGVRWVESNPEAVAVARADGDEEQYAQTLKPLDYRSRQETDAILRLASTWSRPNAVMRALDTAGRDLLYRHGAFAEARRIFEELLSLSQSCGSLPSQVEALENILISQLASSDLAHVPDTLRRAQEVVRGLGPTYHMHRFLAMSRASGLAYFLGGDWTAIAEESRTYATSTAAARSPVGIVAGALAVLSTSHVDCAESLRLLEHLTLVLERVPPAVSAHNIAVSVGAIAVWEMQETNYAATYRRLALDVLQAGVGDSTFGPLDLSVARMAALLGNHSEACDYFARARRKANEHGYVHVRAITDYDEACASQRAGVLRDQEHIAVLLDRALDGFRAQGMLDWERRAQAARTVLPSPRAAVDLPAGLTAREVDVLKLLSSGHTNRQIARELVVSVPTVERHVANIYAKIGAGRRFDAMQFAISHGLAARSDGVHSDHHPSPIR